MICGDGGCGDALYVKGGRQETALLTIIGCPRVTVLQCDPVARAQSQILMITTCFLLASCSVCLMVDHGERNPARVWEGVVQKGDTEGSSLAQFASFARPSKWQDLRHSPYSRSSTEILQRFPRSTMEFTP